MWGHLRLVGTFKFSLAQIFLEEIRSYLSEKSSRGKNNFFIKNKIN